MMDFWAPASARPRMTIKSWRLRPNSSVNRDGCGLPLRGFRKVGDGFSRLPKPWAVATEAPRTHRISTSPGRTGASSHSVHECQASPMARRKTINERRLTRRQVQDLISSGARSRPDLAATFEETFSTGYKERPLVYELEGERYLFVFDPADSSLGGKGDIYSAESFHRLVRWTARAREDCEHGRDSSVGHWIYYSAFKDQLIAHIDTLIEQLRMTMSRAPDD